MEKKESKKKSLLNSPSLNTKRRILEYLKPLEEWKDYIFLFDEWNFFHCYYSDAYVLSYLFGFTITPKEWRPSSWFPRSTFEKRLEELRLNGYSYAIWAKEDTWRYNTINDWTKSLDIFISNEETIKALSEIKNAITSFEENNKNQPLRFSLEDFFNLYEEIKTPFLSILNKWNIKNAAGGSIEKKENLNFKSWSLTHTKSPDIDIIWRIKEINEVNKNSIPEQADSTEDNIHASENNQTNENNKTEERDILEELRQEKSKSILEQQEAWETTENNDDWYGLPF